MKQFNHRYWNLSVEEKGKTLRVVWNAQDFDEQAYKESLLILLSAIEHFSAHELYLDLSTLSEYFSPNMQDWMVNDWFPQLATSTLKKVNLNIPKKIMGQISVKSVYNSFASDNAVSFYFQDAPA